jgi:dynein heavy chain
MFCGAMGMGRANISQRLIRHFNMIFLPEMEEESLKSIIRRICEWGFNDYVDKVKFATKNIDNISLIIYKKITKQFLPLPKKSHYLFNLRDIMKVV